jgi:hypothetical protein
VGYSVEKAANRDFRFRVGDRSRGRYATPANFPRHDGTPYRGLRARPCGLGFVHRSRTVICRAVPNRSYCHDSQLLHRCTHPDGTMMMGAAPLCAAPCTGVAEPAVPVLLDEGREEEEEEGLAEGGYAAPGGAALASSLRPEDVVRSSPFLGLVSTSRTCRGGGRVGETCYLLYHVQKERKGAVSWTDSTW